MRKREAFPDRRGARTVRSLTTFALIGFFAIGPFGAPANAEITHSWNTGPAYVPESLSNGVNQSTNPLYTFGDGMVAVAPAGQPAISTPTPPTEGQTGIFQRVGAAFLWIKNSAINLVSQSEANSDLREPAQQGTWGLRSFQWNNDTGDKGFELSFTTDSNSGDLYYGIAPVYYGAPTPAEIGCRFSINTTPTANGTLYTAVGVTYLDDEAGIVPQIRAIRIFTCATQTINPDPAAMPYPTNLRIMFDRNVAIGSWGENPERRTVTSGTCRQSDGTNISAVSGISPTYTQTLSAGTIVRPVCPAGSTLNSVKTDVQTKNTGGSWVVTTPGIFETSWNGNTISSNPGCFSGDGCQSTVSPATNTCSVGTVTSRCVAAVGQVVGDTSTVQEEEEPTYVAGDTRCNVSFNLADTAGCVLRWAFVPTNTTQYTDRVKTSINGTFIGTVSGVISGFAAPFTGLAAYTPATVDCKGPAIKMSEMAPIISASKDATLYPFSACSEPNSTLSSVARGGLSLIIGVGGMFLVIQTLLSAFGAKQEVFSKGNQ